MIWLLAGCLSPDPAPLLSTPAARVSLGWHKANRWAAALDPAIPDHHATVAWRGGAR
jgi:hypothetical protein